MPGLVEVRRRYKYALTSFLKERISEGSYSSQALRQFEPDVRELDEAKFSLIDPTGEDRLRITSSLIQVHPNRAALTITMNCQAYCRFCFRKARVGSPDQKVDDFEIEEGLEHVRRDRRISDVLISGGDPFAVPLKTLSHVLCELNDISHVKAVRVHSRVISVDPDRITEGFVQQSLSGCRKIWFYAHVNHPDDLSHARSIRAIEILQKYAIPILTQSVLLAGVNDDPDTLSKLFNTIYENRMIAYHLYTLDHAAGTAHFALSDERVAELYASLSRLSGPARPRLVIVDSFDVKHAMSSDKPEEILFFLKSRRQ